MAQSANPLGGVSIKVERAKKHVHELIAEFNAWRSKDPYRVVIEKHPRTGDITYRLIIAEEIPIAWSAIIGDCIHNLRAALDLLACTLVSANGAQIKRRNGFPIAGTKKLFEADAARKIDGASNAAKSFIHGLKPYKGGNSALWQIHELDIIDKHKIIVPVGPDYLHFGLTSKMVVPWQKEPIRTPTINIKPKANRRPLKNGDILLRVSAANGPIKDKAEFQFVIQIAFGKTQIVDGEPVLPCLKQYGQLVESIVAAAENRFFR